MPCLSIMLHVSLFNLFYVQESGRLLSSRPNIYFNYYYYYFYYYHYCYYYSYYY